MVFMLNHPELDIIFGQYSVSVNTTALESYKGVSHLTLVFPFLTFSDKKQSRPHLSVGG